MPLLDILIPSLEKPTNLSVRDCLPVNNIFVSSAPSLATARQELIEASTTDISMFLDSDITLEPGAWAEESLRLLRDGSDCVVLHPPLAVAPLQSYVSFYFGLRRVLPGSFFGTMATLFRTDMLKGIRIPADLSGAEDLFILLYLRSRGAKIVTMTAPGMHHHSSDPLKKGRWVGSGLKRLQRAVGFRQVFPFVLRNVVLYLPATALVSMLKGRKDAMGYSLALWRAYVGGYLEG